MKYFNDNAFEYKKLVYFKWISGNNLKIYQIIAFNKVFSLITNKSLSNGELLKNKFTIKNRNITNL